MLPQPDGFVRPRYDDGTLDDPLPLADRFREWLQRGPGWLGIQGPRGSGLTTSLRWLAGLLGAEGRRPVFGERVQPRDEPDLRSGHAVLLLDRSVRGRGRRTPAVARGEAWRDPAASLSACVVVVGHDAEVLDPERDLGPASILQLAPWDADDVLELLASDRYRAQRPQLHRALRGLPQAAPLLRRPRTARKVIEALRQEGRAEVAWSELQAALLDGLRPGTLNVLRALPPGACDARALRVALQQVSLEGTDAEELVDLFQLTEPLQALRDRAPSGRGPEPRLAFPGLHHFLQAGDCLRRVARGELPAPVARPWLPHLAELASPALRALLRGWLTAPAAVGEGADGVAVSVLWACGERPSWPVGRPLEAPGALLDGLEAPRAQLRRANLGGASLRASRLEGAELEGATLRAADLRHAVLVEANLDLADLSQARLARAWLDNARLRKAELRGTDLRDARLCGAQLGGAELREAQLERADLAGADLTAACLDACSLDGADLSGADLRLARLTRLELDRLRGLAPATAAMAVFRRCDLKGVHYDELDLSAVSFDQCHLSDLSLRASFLQGATFRDCAMHGVVADGADLRGARFERIWFQAGSSREGLLSGKVALEGNMTGYYVEGASDDAWTSPEAIAQASFCGADLRGARFVGTNLFRVDFRGAQLSPELFAQAQEHGALLDEGGPRR